tara:strand:- start:4651 stop:4800 length:150 start_codon:yes stop_codon:yes gene_type:complete
LSFSFFYVWQSKRVKNKTRLIAQTGLKYVVLLQYISTSLESKNKNDDDV